MSSHKCFIWLCRSRRGGRSKAAAAKDDSEEEDEDEEEEQEDEPAPKVCVEEFHYSLKLSCPFRFFFLLIKSLSGSQEGSRTKKMS